MRRTRRVQPGSSTVLRQPPFLEQHVEKKIIGETIVGRPERQAAHCDELDMLRCTIPLEEDRLPPIEAFWQTLQRTHFDVDYQHAQRV